MWWTIGWLWRRTLWQRMGRHARDLAGGEDPRPVWAGWRVRVGGVDVTWRLGPFGPGTRVGRKRFAGLLSAERIRAALREG